jgi:hypothetical protein
MFQTTTIITGPNAGARFTGAGSHRAARAAAKGQGRSFITKFVMDGTVSYTAWDANGFITASY